MKDGFLRVAAASPRVKPADPKSNAESVISALREAGDARLFVFPELFLTGYTCGDFFFQESLIGAAEEALAHVLCQTSSCDALAAIGLPARYRGRLFNCAAVIHRGRLLGIVTKTYLPDMKEFNESRYFASGFGVSGEITYAGHTVPFGNDLVFDGGGGFAVGFEICRDAWVKEPPSNALTSAGALVIGNLSASNELIGKWENRRELVRARSERLACAYVYASNGEGESSAELVFSGHRIIAECGKTLGEASLLGGQGSGVITADIDLGFLQFERGRIGGSSFSNPPVRRVSFAPSQVSLELDREFSPAPFIPSEPERLAERCRQVLALQTAALRQRLEATGKPAAVVALSGGLDSALALLVAHRAADRVLAVTMPGPGTTPRTLANSEILCRALSVPLKIIPISDALSQHLKDIGHGGAPDLTYENAQARERTQIAMDIANQIGGLVVGTSDLSEIALGFSTYNGDHMSMYNVNAGVPKTLIRHILRYAASQSLHELAAVLEAVSREQVSPELLPLDAEGIQRQRTEDILGDYALHEFFLYHFLRRGSAGRKLMRIARLAFAGKYDDAEIERAHKTFFSRFVAAQYKRSCSPDGVKQGSVSFSRKDWQLPGDISAAFLP